MIVDNCFRFQDTKFYFNSFEKRRFKFFLFDVWFWSFREKYRVKGYGKNVSLFLKCKNVSLRSISTQEYGAHSDLAEVRFNFTPRAPDLNPFDFSLWGSIEN